MINAKEDYWGLVNHKWDDILRILNDQLDLGALAFEIPGDPESPITHRTVLEELLILKRTQDPKIVRYFNAAWGMASESYCWSKPSWGQFCDLCSEEWVLNEEEGNPYE